MTVKLLVDWKDPRNGREYKCSNLLTTDTATENGLVSEKQADINLSGGTSWSPPALVAKDQAEDILPLDAFSSTCYMFRSPITQATNLISDQRECYLPTDADGVYLGAFFGKRIKTNTAETLTDLGLFKAGLHTWHGSLTKTGLWTTSPTGVSTGAFQATGASYSQTSGDTISGDITGTVAAIRYFLTSNGGYAVVSIDGDFTRANKLPVFTKANYDDGLCRAGDVGRRYYSSYAAAPTSEILCIATDLAPGAHRIVVEVTGTKPAASSGTRAWVEGFSGCNGQTLGSANVHAVPVQWVYHDLASWSAFDSIISWAPTGSVDYQFLGNIHGDGTQSKEVSTVGPTWTIGVTDVTALAAGTWASGPVIRCDHTSTLAHKVNTAVAVATRTRRWILAPSRKLPIMCDSSIAWSSAGVVNIEYPVMLPLGEVIGYAEGKRQEAFATFHIGHYEIPILATNDDGVSYFTTETRRLIAVGPKVKAWAEVVSETPDRGGMYASHGGSMQDRADKADKLYTISAVGPQPYASGDVQRFVIGWGARLT